MKIYLMRHGEACNPDQDPERGLTENGKEKIRLLAEHLSQKDITFKHVIHSPKKRARETAEIMRSILSPSASISEYKAIQPNDDPQLFASEISTWEEDTLVASHLPYVPNLLTYLSGSDAYLSPISFETGTIVCLEKVSATKWKIAWHSAPSEI